MASYNIDNGFPTAIVTALRKGFLGPTAYETLRTVSNIAEFKLALEDTDYGADIFSNMDTSQFEVQALRRSMKERLFNELMYIKGQSVYPLDAFLTKMLHSYQIDNVIYMIEGLKSGRNPKELLKMADPLGYFDELKNVSPVEGDDYHTLYQYVLIDLPVGEYFRKFIEEETASVRGVEDNSHDINFISEVMKDYSLDQIQLRVKKIWLQDFHTFCET
jgi:V-type H+-transporting ATPase subunit d